MMSMNAVCLCRNLFAGKQRNPRTSHTNGADRWFGPTFSPRKRRLAHVVLWFFLYFPRRLRKIS